MIPYDGTVRELNRLRMSLARHLSDDGAQDERVNLEGSIDAIAVAIRNIRGTVLDIPGYDCMADTETQ